MRKFHDARATDDKVVDVWGTGSPMREFLHVDDLADACLFLIDEYSDVGHVNVGTGVDLPIRELAEKIRDVVCPEAELRFDPSKPDGTPRKVLDTSKLNALGWKPSIELDAGLASTYAWFLEQVESDHGPRGA
jgi:GDP-L-fucose synthase